MNLREKVDDLIKQAATDNSHFYTCNVLQEVRNLLLELEEECEDPFVFTVKLENGKGAPMAFIPASKFEGLLSNET